VSEAAEVAAPLRILHVVEVFGSGVGEVAKTLAERLAAGGDTVAIAHGRCPETPAEVRGFVTPDVELYELPWERRSAREQLDAARELRALVRRWQPDVVHLHSSFAGVVGALSLRRSMPSTYTPHGYSFTMLDRSRSRRFAYRMLERFTASRVNLVGAVSEAEAEDGRRVAPARKVTVVRNGIPELDDPAGGGARPAAARPRVVTVGRIAEQHLPPATARILASVSELADVTWIGSGGRSPELEAVVREQGVEVTGWLPRAEVQSMLSSSIACLHWSAWDGQPLSILEAMANDVVVVASDIPATREILGPRQVCASEEQAMKLLRAILVKPALRRELLRSQRERRVNYSARRMAAEWRTVYERMARPAGARGASLGVKPAAVRGSDASTVEPRRPQTVSRV
jgi:glycosyltransferase involved in cell wall biosynthesis